MSTAIEAMALKESIRKMAPVAAAEAERQDFADLFQALEERREQGEPEFRLLGPNNQEFALPESAFYMLVRLVEVMARGDAITLVPIHKELTTQQTADILNMSRQYLVRLLDQGEIPFTRSGTHRRIRFEDVVIYKQKRDRERLTSLDELAQLTQELGAYGELP